MKRRKHVSPGDVISNVYFFGFGFFFFFFGIFYAKKPHVTFTVKKHICTRKKKHS